MSARQPPHLFDALSRSNGNRYKWQALTVVGLGMVAAVLPSASFGVAIPALMRDFGLGQDQIQWVVTGFMGALTVSMLPTPWLLDRMGFRRCFIGAMAILATSSVIGFLSWHFPVLVAVRIVQGAMAGVLHPLTTLAVLRLFPIEQQGRASGVLGLGIVLAPAVAPTLSGLLLDHFGWSVLFLINLPFCVIAGVAAVVFLPPSPGTRATPFDWVGVGLLGIGTLCMVAGVTGLRHGGLTSFWTVAPLSLTLVAICLFIIHGQIKSELSVIHLRLFRRRSFAMGTVVSFVCGFGLYAFSYLIPVFMQNALGYSATATGVALLPSGIGLALAIPGSGRLADRYPPHHVAMAGLVLCGISFLAFSALGEGIGYRALVALTVIGYVGQALTLPSVPLASLRNMETSWLGQSSMVTSYARQIGGVMGVAVLAVFVEWREAVHGTAVLGTYMAFSQAFMLLAVVFVLALLAASQMKESTSVN